MKEVIIKLPKDKVLTLNQHYQTDVEYVIVPTESQSIEVIQPQPPQESNTNHNYATTFLVVIACLVMVFIAFKMDSPMGGYQDDL